MVSLQQHALGESPRSVRPRCNPCSLSHSFPGKSQPRCPRTPPTAGAAAPPGRTQPCPRRPRPRAGACGAPPLPAVVAERWRCCWCCRRSTGRTWAVCRGPAAEVGAARAPRAGGNRAEPGRGCIGVFSIFTAIGELGRLALEQLRRGASPRACETAARKLNIGVDTIQHGVEGLVYLLTESSKLMISEVDFQDSIHVLGFSDELNKSLLQLYLDNRKEIRSILGELAPRLPSYHSLEWRLDVQLASRSLRQQIKPAVTMKLHLNQNEDQTAQVLQTDPATLLHLIQQLEQALGEMKMNHCRRIVRNMK